MIKAHLHLPKMKANNPRCISVKPKDGPTYYVAEMMMEDVIFKVSEAGRQRTITNKQRNVHAWVKAGKVIDKLPTGEYREAYYNPFKVETFVDKETGEPLNRASYAYMIGSKVFYRA